LIAGRQAGGHEGRPSITDWRRVPVEQLKQLIDNWILIAQGLIGSIGALAFLVAFMYKIVAVEPRSVMEAKRWIGRIVFGTIGVEIAGTLTHALISTVPSGLH
jgi:hypothetical protein